MKFNNLTVTSNSQSPDGRWHVTRNGRHYYATEYPDNIKKYLKSLHIAQVLFDVDGQGTMRNIPVGWIGDGKPIEGSDRALKLV
jgi:hypothetical protein